MKFLLIGGHADGRRIEMTDSDTLTSIAVPRQEHLSAGRPIATSDWYRSVPASKNLSPGGCHLLVHQSIRDEEIFPHLIARYPGEPPSEKRT